MDQYGSRRSEFKLMLNKKQSGEKSRFLTFPPIAFLHDLFFNLFHHSGLIAIVWSFGSTFIFATRVGSRNAAPSTLPVFVYRVSFAGMAIAPHISRCRLQSSVTVSGWMCL